MLFSHFKKKFKKYFILGAQILYVQNRNTAF